MSTKIKNKVLASLLPPKLELPLEELFDQSIDVADSSVDWMFREIRKLVDTFYEQAEANIVALEASAVNVYRSKKGDSITVDRYEVDTHRGLLIAVEPIERGVTVTEIVDMLRFHGFERLADRIDGEGIKR